MELADDEVRFIASVLSVPRVMGGWFLDDIEDFLDWPAMSGNKVLLSLIEKGLIVRIGSGDRFDLSEEGMNLMRFILDKRVGRASRR